MTRSAQQQILHCITLIELSRNSMRLHDDEMVGVCGTFFADIANLDHVVSELREAAQSIEAK